MNEENYDSLLIKALGSSPKLRILDYLLDYKLNDFKERNPRSPRNEQTDTPQILQGSTTARPSH